MPPRADAPKDAADEESESLDQYIERLAREGRPDAVTLVSRMKRSGRWRLLREPNAETLRLDALRARELATDPDFLNRAGLWAEDVLRNPGLGPSAPYARAILKARKTLRESGCTHTRAMLAALRLGALVMECALLLGWKTDAVAGRKSRSQGPRGREGGHKGGRRPLISEADIQRLMGLRGGALRRETESVAYATGVEADSVRRRLDRSRHK